MTYLRPISTLTNRLRDMLLLTACDGSLSASEDSRWGIDGHAGDLKLKGKINPNRIDHEQAARASLSE